ncbi:MAG: PIN domain-containing protein [archaeon]|nr:PIN domain-containing protein [archaeon]
MQYLIDTNVFLEGLLEQERVSQVRTLFQRLGSVQLALTDFSLHSIGVILFGLGKARLFTLFLDNIIVDGVRIHSLGIDDLRELDTVAKTFTLDFDDAYQYVVAEKYNLQIVSFDTDFDRTERGRKTPAEVVQ